MINIYQYKILKLPELAYYIPNFIKTEEEKFLLEKIYSAPKPKWKVLSNRRLQNWGGLPHVKGMIQEDLPPWLSDYVTKVNDLQIFGDKFPNHVLINEYLPGQGIMPHEDGPLFYPTIATINIGSHTILNYYEKTSNEINQGSKLEDEVTQNVSSHYIGSLLLEPCSLLVVQDKLYDKYLHGIEEKKMDLVSDSVKNLDFCKSKIGSELERKTRISITIRHVPKTVKAKFLLGIK